MSRLSLLVVDDDPPIRRIFTQLVAEREGVEVVEASSAEEAQRLLAAQAFDAAFVDLRMPGTDGLELLERFKKEHPSLDVVMVSAHGTIEAAVQAMKLGASDFLPKPFKLDQVTVILQRLKKVSSLRSENERLRRELKARYHAKSLAGSTAAIERCHEMIDRVRREDCTVLVLGESGTGKDLVARAIHYDGPRAAKPFVPVDCGAIQGSLLESELFGHEKGAFTGAHARKVGLFEEAQGGTLFLDEVGELPLELQPALLRVMQNKEIRPVGSTKARAVDVRIVAATNRPLEDMVAEGRFRRDLYYRLNVVTIKVPPLRERKDDVPLLVDLFLRRFAERSPRKILGVVREAMYQLQRYDWPGNVRELENAVERACALGRGDWLEIDDFPAAIRDEGGTGTAGAIARTIEDLEVAAIRRILEECSGDTGRAATILGINRATLYRKVKRHGIVIPRRPRLR